MKLFCQYSLSWGDPMQLCITEELQPMGHTAALSAPSQCPGTPTGQLSGGGGLSRR